MLTCHSTEQISRHFQLVGLSNLYDSKILISDAGSVCVTCEHMNIIGYNYAIKPFLHLKDFSYSRLATMSTILLALALLLVLYRD